MRRWLTLGGVVALATLAALTYVHFKPTTDSLYRDPDCIHRYKQLFSEPELKVSVFFGYKDARPQRYVGDRYERARLVQKVTRKCGRDDLCGFERSPDDANLFYKNITLPWGSEKRVILEIADSSVAADDQANRNNPFQHFKSAKTREAFHKALTSSHVIFYNGHSRAGGGPDFYPPKINSTGKVLYTEYREQQQGFMDVLEVMGRESLKSRAQLLGLFSCKSSQHFTNELKKERPDLALISSPSLIYYQDALENTAQALSALLRQECQDDFQRRLKHKDPIKGSLLADFF